MKLRLLDLGSWFAHMEGYGATHFRFLGIAGIRLGCLLVYDSGQGGGYVPILRYNLQCGINCCR